MTKLKRNKQSNEKISAAKIAVLLFNGQDNRLTLNGFSSTTSFHSNDQADMQGQSGKWLKEMVRWLNERTNERTNGRPVSWTNVLSKHQIYMKRIICVAVLLTYACPFISFYTLQ